MDNDQEASKNFCYYVNLTILVMGIIAMFCSVHVLSDMVINDQYHDLKNSTGDAVEELLTEFQNNYNPASAGGEMIGGREAASNLTIAASAASFYFGFTAYLKKGTGPVWCVLGLVMAMSCGIYFILNGWNEPNMHFLEQFRYVMYAFLTMLLFVAVVPFNCMTCCEDYDSEDTLSSEDTELSSDSWADPQPNSPEDKHEDTSRSNTDESHETKRQSSARPAVDSTCTPQKGRAIKRRHEVHTLHVNGQAYGYLQRRRLLASTGHSS